MGRFEENALIQEKRKMRIKIIVLGILAFVCAACNTQNQNIKNEESISDLIVSGAMRNVMQKGELEGVINLDTIQDKTGLYGIGPESYLTGELLIKNGKSYVSRVLSDTTMMVEETFNVSAPFFVRGTVNEWKEIEINKPLDNIKALENYLIENTKEYKRPFVFKLIGKVKKAEIHVQNLPKGTKVSSPAEAHQGQVNYVLANEEVEIIGFYSTKHKGVFTHHDSFMHLHLITADKKKMGHLDEIEIDSIKLYLPTK